MIVKRRSFLLWSGLAAVAAGTGYTLNSGLRDWLRGQISDDFGPEIAQSDDTSDFLDDYMVLLKAEKSRQFDLASVYFRLKPAALPVLLSQEYAIRGHLLHYFARSTNAILALEVERSFTYVGLFIPEQSACQNQLSAFML